MSSDFRAFPADPAAVARLGGLGLDYRVLSPDDREALAVWSGAEHRGFHHPRPTPETVEREVALLQERRVHGVYDPELGDGIPVGTVASWPTGLSVPGGRSVDGWAVSAVTVAPTHRRRGIARAMMQAELANAVTAGAAVAMLTATEATLYGRYGYAPAARAATLEIDRRRVEWAGAEVPGLVRFVTDAAGFRRSAGQIVRRQVARTPGEIDRWPALVDRVLGLDDPDGESARATRVARYDDARGQAHGFVSYRITRDGMGAGVVEFDFLAAASDEAEAALWRFLLEQDFVSTVRARLRSVDEPLRWLLVDQRAITTTVGDHLWLRILDPAAALEARRYEGPGSLVLELDDPLGHASGRYALEVSARGVAEVQRLDGGAQDASGASTPTGATAPTRRSKPAHGLRLGVDALAAMYLGDARASLLARAGRIEETGPGSLAVADRLFATNRAPRLSIWF
ncbi:GNAT family N-acetyltransferase [Agromyces mediolanus]|uniref:GNAT family N-acetyltransferase n=1 Tax=Agromyces mediolanus TaxID=41986 RepID=UPI00203B9A10|nr:GNAT family N-acetyltransferase [Agromyces mediolanus]MCM3658770.1 GNAT family N-acetyltransferase [Agromyces mediolanus]